MKTRKSYKYSGIFTNGHFSVKANSPQHKDFLPALSYTIYP